MLCPLFLIWRVTLWVGPLVASFSAFSWGCCWAGRFGGGAGTLANTTSTPTALAGIDRAGVIITARIITGKPGKRIAPEALHKEGRRLPARLDTGLMNKTA
jgi:hypothetical protein